MKMSQQSGKSSENWVRYDQNRVRTHFSMGLHRFGHISLNFHQICLIFGLPSWQLVGKWCGNAGLVSTSPNQSMKTGFLQFLIFEIKTAVWSFSSLGPVWFQFFFGLKTEPQSTNIFHCTTFLLFCYFIVVKATVGLGAEASREYNIWPEVATQPQIADRMSKNNK